MFKISCFGDSQQILQCNSSWFTSCHTFITIISVVKMSQRWNLKFFGSKILEGVITSEVRNRNFHAPIRSHYTEKFSAITPTNSYNKPKYTLHFDQFLHFSR